MWVTALTLTKLTAALGNTNGLVTCCMHNTAHIVAPNLLHSLNSCWERPTCHPLVNTEIWEFLSPHLCGPSVRQAVTYVCSSGWRTWKLLYTTHVCSWAPAYGWIWMCTTSHPHSDERQSCKTKYGLISLAHKVNLLYKSTYLLSPHQLSSGFLTPPLFHSLCIQSFFSSVPLISLKGEPLRGFKAAYTNSVELWHTHSKDVTLSWRF